MHIATVVRVAAGARQRPSRCKLHCNFHHRAAVGKPCGICWDSVRKEPSSGCEPRACHRDVQRHCETAHGECGLQTCSVAPAGAGATAAERWQ